MTSVVDLFNPTLLIFLGILVLVVALLVVYFESKMRDQNHKIASVVSLVSTLADDMNGVKMGLNHLIMKGGQMIPPQPPIFYNNLGNNEEKRELIVVSDDEESDNEESDNEESDNEESDNEVTDDSSEIYIHEDSSDDDNEQELKTDKNIKILKLNISNDEQEIETNNEIDLGETDLDGDFEPSDELPEIGNEYVEEVLDLKYNEDSKVNKFLEEHMDEQIFVQTDLKTISINLGEENNTYEGNIDYKKLQLSKLRSIVVEKGLVSNIDVAKLKKPEIFKLLGVE